jgi:hypothetical protein
MGRLRLQRSVKKNVTSKDMCNGKPWSGGQQIARRQNQPTRQGI